MKVFIGQSPLVAENLNISKVFLNNLLGIFCVAASIQDGDSKQLMRAVIRVSEVA
jgi:hypothetical protein